MRIPIATSFGKGLILLLVGVTRRASFVEVGDDTVVVHLGWAFHASIPRASIRGAEHVHDVPLTAGAHGWAGRWLVNGARGPLVRMTIEPRARGWVTGVPVRLRELTVSVADPDALLAALTPVAH